MRAHAHPVSSDRGSDKPAPCFLRLAARSRYSYAPAPMYQRTPRAPSTDRVLSTIDTRVLHGACDFNQLCISESPTPAA